MVRFKDDLWFEDFTPGMTFMSDGITLTESQIIGYALIYDPLPFHIDVEAGANHQSNGLFASGLHTLSLAYRLFHMTGALVACSYSGAGLDKARWLHRVRPGDTLHTLVEVLSTKPSRSRPDLGSLVIRHDVVNQKDVTVLTFECTHIVRTRPDTSSR